MSIAVIGSINMDYNSRVEKLPQRGETVLSHFFQMKGGGKGANQAIAASRLGADVHMVGAVGKDSAGEFLLRCLKDEGIDTSGIYQVAKPTGNALITIDDEGDNTIVAYSGANSCVDVEKINAHSHQLEKCKLFIIQLEIPLETVCYAISFAHDRDIPVILNPAPAAELPMEIYPLIYTITPNETEVRTLTGIEDIEKGARKLLDFGVKEVIVTLGDKGSFYTNGAESFYVDAFEADVVDTTAAGDSFNGAFAVARLEGQPTREALGFSNAVGSLTATKFGAYDSLPYRSEVDEFLFGN